ncbi:MAG: type II toxin-antitoxin system VapC family toxin [Candidatus Binataceae bacterium]
MKRLLDTNAVLYLLGGRLADPLPKDEYLVSVITKMELLCYPSLDRNAEAKIRSFLADVEVVGLTEPVAEAAVEIRRKHGPKLPDAIVAAAALTTGAELLTNDEKLSRITGIVCRRLKLRRS